MFNKDEYWKNREAKKRGQGEDTTQRIIPKGEMITVKNTKTGKKEQVPAVEHGAAGQHMIRIGGKIQLVDRKTARRSRLRLRVASKKGYKQHEVKEPFTPQFQGGVSNHQRHVGRRIQREQQAKMKVAAK